MTGIASPLPRIHFIRHGETAWSLSGQHTGRTDLPLTEHGEQDVRKLAGRFRTVRFSCVLTSPLQRARRTCELAGLNVGAVASPDLTEWDYGDYEGKRPGDIRHERPDWSIFRDGCPRGESPTQVCERADRLIARLRSLEGNILPSSRTATLAASWRRVGSTCRSTKRSISCLAPRLSAFSGSSTIARECRRSSCGTLSRTNGSINCRGNPRAPLGRRRADCHPYIDTRLDSLVKSARGVG